MLTFGVISRLVIISALGSCQILWVYLQLLLQIPSVIIRRFLMIFHILMAGLAYLSSSSASASLSLGTGTGTGGLSIYVLDLTTLLYHPHAITLNLGMGILLWLLPINGPRLLLIALSSQLIMTLLHSNVLFISWLAIEGLSLCSYLLLAGTTGNIRYYIMSLLTTHSSLVIYLYLSPMSLMTDGTLLMTIILFIKVGAFPFHQWMPTLYSTIPLPLMLWYHIPIKSGLYLAMLQWHNSHSHSQSQITYFLILWMILQLCASCLLLLHTFETTRFIALSSLYMTSTLLLMISPYSYMLYYMVYTISIYMLLTRLGSQVILQILIVLSVLGIPPLPGYWAKLYVLGDLIGTYGYSYNLALIYLCTNLIISGQYLRVFIINIKEESNLCE